MTTTYTWDIQNVDLLTSHLNNENVVFKVVWQCTATSDDGASKSQVGVVELDVNDTSVEFIPIENVTKDMIVEWVKQSVAVQSIENSILPNVKTVSFNNDSTTVAEALAASATVPVEPPEM
jgi:hypothetical protein